MNRRTKRKLKKLARDFIGGCSCILAFLSAGCLDSAENLAPPIIVLVVSLLILNRLYGEY